MLSGGSASKLGHRYEKWWTVYQLLRMLDGATAALRIEVPGIDKAEFVVTTTDQKQEYHQVKRSHTSAKWTLSSLGLGPNGLLRSVFDMLRDNTDRFVFVSGSEARELSDLCESARDSVSIKEFEHKFLDAVHRKRHFDSLCSCWGCDASIAIEILKRIDVRTIDESELRDKIGWAIQALLKGDRNTIQSELGDMVEDSIHGEFTRQSLSKILTKRGHYLRPDIAPQHAIPAVERATDRYLRSVRDRLIQKTLVPNEASKEILARLDGSASDCVVTGRAGTGKTACVIELVDALRARAQPVLAFRLDRTSSASTTEGLGNDLGLEESPVLVLAEAARSAARPGVLIVDQLDAVSTISGRSLAAFEVVEQLIQEARGKRDHVTIHTVVVCREFDWKNDSRLRGLLSASPALVDVTAFGPEQVEKALRKGEFNPARFYARQLELLRLPQNLAMFLESGFDPSIEPKFDTDTKILDEYWKRKRQLVENSTGKDCWMAVMETLCDEMSSAQRLWVSREELDQVSSTYLDCLVSEGVLTFDERRYGFGHESLFDYAFARLFVTRGESITSFLKASEQHLFRRSQVRQILAYLRDAYRARYERELRALLEDCDIRVHVKELAFTLLAEVSGPTDGEWEIWMTWTTKVLSDIAHGMEEEGSLHSLAWHRLFGAKSWFSYIDGRGMIQDWLVSGNEYLVDLAVSYLRVHHVHAPNRVAALVGPYVDCGGRWIDRLCSLMERTRHSTSRPYFELLLRLVDNGTLDKIGRTVWSMLYNLCDKRPEWVPEVVAHYLRRRVAVIIAAGEDLLDSKLIGYDDTATRLVRRAAERAPVEFVEHVLPAVLYISDSSLVTEEPPRHDAVWYTFIKSEDESGEHACLSALAGALTKLGDEGHGTIPGIIGELRSRDTYVANLLLQFVYRGTTPRLADDAASMLCEQQWRLRCGFASSPYWRTREMIGAVIRHCSAHARRMLEDVVMNYVDPYERPSVEFRYNAIGHAAFQLLSVFPQEELSPHASRRFGEWERRFGPPDTEAKGVEVGPVESPISESATAAMTDEQWRLAIKKHYSDMPAPSASTFFVGGARQLAQVLERRAKEDPERFSRLILTLPGDANPVYLEHVLHALRDASINADIKLDVCRKAYGESREYFGRAITDVIEGISDSLPRDAVDMLSWLGTEHNNPERELWDEDAGNGQPYYGGDIYSHGINSTRGSAAEAIRRLILNDPAYIKRFRPTIERMISDRSVAVRSCVAGVLRAVSYHDRRLGVSLFLRMDLKEDRLFATIHVDEFISDHLRHEFPALRPTVERMLRSTEPEICKAGGRLASIAAVLHEDALDLGEEALRGNRHHRVGVAQVAAVNISKFREWCEPRLAGLFDDDDAKVRGQAAHCFSRLPAETLSSYGNLIEAFCNSAAFARGMFWLFFALERSSGRLPGMTCLACEQSLSARSVEKHLATKLIFRTYQQHQDDEWASRSLDLIDRLCLEGPWGADRELEEFDR